MEIELKELNKKINFKIVGFALLVIVLIGVWAAVFWQRRKALQMAPEVYFQGETPNLLDNGGFEGN